MVKNIGYGFWTFSYVKNHVFWLPFSLCDKNQWSNLKTRLTDLIGILVWTLPRIQALQGYKHSLFLETVQTVCLGTLKTSTNNWNNATCLNHTRIRTSTLKQFSQLFDLIWLIIDFKLQNIRSNNKFAVKTKWRIIT